MNYSIFITRSSYKNNQGGKIIFENFPSTIGQNGAFPPRVEGKGVLYFDLEFHVGYIYFLWFLQFWYIGCCYHFLLTQFNLII